MKIVTRRRPGEDALRDSAILQRTLNALRGNALVPRGVYRFASHEEADAWMTHQIRGYSRAPEFRDLAALCRSLNRSRYIGNLNFDFALVSISTLALMRVSHAALTSSNVYDN